MQDLPNLHVLTVKYSGATDTRGSRIIIRSDRFKKSKSISYDHNYNSSLDGAIAYLEANGFNLVGKGNGKDCDYVITDTFDSL